MSFQICSQNLLFYNILHGLPTPSFLFFLRILFFPSTKSVSWELFYYSSLPVLRSDFFTSHALYSIFCSCAQLIHICFPCLTMLLFGRLFGPSSTFGLFEPSSTFGYLGHQVLSGYLGHQVVWEIIKTLVSVGNQVPSGYLGHQVPSGHFEPSSTFGYLGHQVLSGY
jgi:hypothetical protein